MRQQQKDLPLYKSSVKPVVLEVLAQEGVSTDEISVHFISNIAMCQLHEEFFNDPSPTDCITFPIDGKEGQSLGYHVLGEIFICPRAALNFAPESVFTELTLYLVHGILHLLGYDDIALNHRKKMRAAEERHMKNLLSKKLLLKGR